MADDDEAREIVMSGPFTDRALDMAQQVVIGMNLKALTVVYSVDDRRYYNPDVLRDH